MRRRIRKLNRPLTAYVLVVVACIIGFLLLQRERDARRVAVDNSVRFNCERANRQGEILSGLVKVSLAGSTSRSQFREHLLADLSVLSPRSPLADVIQQLLTATDQNGRSARTFRAAFETALVQLRPVDCTKQAEPNQP